MVWKNHRLLMRRTFGAKLTPNMAVAPFPKVYTPNRFSALVSWAFLDVMKYTEVSKITGWFMKRLLFVLISGIQSWLSWPTRPLKTIGVFSQMPTSKSWPNCPAKCRQGVQRQMMHLKRLIFWSPKRLAAWLLGESALAFVADASRWTLVEHVLFFAFFVGFDFEER